LAAALGTAAVLAIAAGATIAGPRHDGGRMTQAGEPGSEFGMGGAGMHPRMFERMASELGLSDAQRQSIRGLYESARPAMQQRREQARANAELLRKTQPGDQDYQAVVARVSRAAGELAAAAVSDGAQLRAQVWGVLTPEQRVKAQQLGEQRQQRREERRAKFRDRMEQRSKGGGMPPPGSGS
jgi:Spy/CpxP family protein refolding chaperone